MKNIFTRLLAASVLLTGITSFAIAQDYPTRPITLIVPFAAGGPADFLGRLLGQKLGEELGQQIVIDNRPGANTIIGAQAVVRAPADGYTLLLAIDGTLVMNPYMYSKLAYDPFNDFVPISQVAVVPVGITANNNTPANTVKEMISLEKATPGRFMIGNSTPTTQVAIELLNIMAGTKMLIVPYKGGNTQVTATLAGDIPFAMESINVALPLYRAGKLKILGLTTDKRLSFAPEIPTIAETFPGYDLGIWQSLVARTGTPKPILDRLYAATAKVLAMPDVREKITGAGMEPAASSSPEAFAGFIKRQAEIRSKVINEVGIKID